MDTVRESIGVQKKVWEADYSTFGQGVENAPLVKAWINEPDDPTLLGMFGNLTREQFSACKANGDTNPPPVTPTANLKQGKKRARESGGPGSEGALKKHRSSSDVNPPASAGKS
ncbi:hypothetical protein EXIGLDRAFT_733368 [Exidia glandulosa HHB12029]|uniref:Uncharacterized protein n=1 Tax=Exidia glandulosa HHB12029 TaxID=1314781 RepID=A0A165BBJ5_EXIGL|nr:hypothetical protein EXIGLDRAFT_733368 [Exidia glandulosa HHB12029]